MFVTGLNLGPGKGVALTDLYFIAGIDGITIFIGNSDLPHSRITIGQGVLIGLGLYVDYHVLQTGGNGDGPVLGVDLGGNIAINRSDGVALLGGQCHHNLLIGLSAVLVASSITIHSDGAAVGGGLRVDRPVSSNSVLAARVRSKGVAGLGGGGHGDLGAITEAGKAQVFEFQISDALAAALAEGTLAYGIRLKYNAYHTDGDDLPNRNFNIYSIILMGKDDVPEPTVAPSEPEEPTPTPGVASGSAAVVVTATGSAAGLDLEEGDTLDLNASVSTTGCAVTGDIVWTSSNEEVATVSASGASATVTAVGEGTATIKATITTDTGIVTYGKYIVKVVASDLVLEGDDLGAGASYTYVPNGFALYASMGIFEIDKSKLSKEGTTISIKYTAMEGDTDVKDTQRFNIGLKTGDKWNSPAIKDYYGKTGGEVNLTLTADDMKKIGADDKVYVHVGTGTAGFKGTFT